MNDTLTIDLGKRIKELRTAAGLTQAELAALTLKSIETISNFERGKTTPSLLTLALMAEKMKVSMRDFFELELPTPAADPFTTTVLTKAQLLTDADKELLLDFVDLLISRSR